MRRKRKPYVANMHYHRRRAEREAREERALACIEKQMKIQQLEGLGCKVIRKSNHTKGRSGGRPCTILF